jgi:NADPH:quinone reductase-like Zn-dependent oxidoreductase
VLADGTRVFALGEGMMAEKAIINKNRMVPLPDGMDEASACALPNAVAGSAMALRFRAAMRPGETVLINGATGFTGRIAVQVAKHYGAKRIIVTGRNQASLEQLRALGADETVTITPAGESFTEQIKALHHRTPIDVIVDYLWGPTAEQLLASLKGNGSFTHKTRFVSVGSITGDKIQLSAEQLRSVDLQLSGSGLGSWTREEMNLLFSDILPEMFQLVVNRQLQVDTVKVPLHDIEKLWEREPVDGKRWVVMI